MAPTSRRRRFTRCPADGRLTGACSRRRRRGADRQLHQLADAFAAKAQDVRPHKTGMELFGIILSIPVAFVASVVYCLLLAKIIIRVDPLRRLLWVVSVGVLSLFAVEILLLVTIGAIHSRESIGPVFYPAHLAVFCMGTPALANVLILRNPRSTFRWYWAVPACTIFAFALVLLQYGVSEALYGVEGTNGPFSERQIPVSAGVASCQKVTRRAA
jgi:hypothetical protein